MIYLPLDAVRRRLLKRGLPSFNRASFDEARARARARPSPVQANNDAYPSITAAARALGVSHGTITNRIARGAAGYAYR